MICKLRVWPYRNVATTSSSSLDGELLLHLPYTELSVFTTYSYIRSASTTGYIAIMDTLAPLLDGFLASTHSDAIDALRAFFLFAACTVRTQALP